VNLASSVVRPFFPPLSDYCQLLSGRAVGDEQERKLAELPVLKAEWSGPIGLML
jgi:hypothetical protein